MQKKFFSNLVFLVVLNLLVKPFWVFGIDRTVQNRVGVEDYGLYFALFNFTFLFNILLDAGINNFNNRNISQHHQLLTKQFSGIASLKIILLLLYVTVIISSGYLIGYRDDQIFLLAWIGLNHGLALFILYMQSNISGLQMFRTNSIISVLDRVLMIIFCSLLLWGNITEQPFRIEWFIMVQTISYLITLAAAFIVILPRIERVFPKWDLPFFIAILKHSFPFALLILLMTIYIRADTVMLERMLPDGKIQAGIYAQSYRILEAANMFAYLFPTLLLPMFSKMLATTEKSRFSPQESEFAQKQNRFQKINGLLTFSFSILFCAATVLCAITLFYSKPILGILYRQHFEQGPAILTILMFTFIGFAVMYTFSTLLTAHGRLSELNTMAFAAVTLNITMNFFFIPHFGALGCSIAALVTQFFAATVQIILVRSIFSFHFERQWLIRTAGFCIGVFGTGYIVSKFGFNPVSGGAIIITAASLLFFVCGIISFTDIKKYFSEMV
ncbi:MAG: oligosaccharide flippase family protein [Bacteroidetes bacterium]|nr:oligosaccharide flippase family protein [Bacteroidota bacterium]